MIEKNERIESCSPLFIDIKELPSIVNKEWVIQMSKKRKYLVTNYLLKNSFEWKSILNGITEYYYLLEEILKDA